MICKKRINWSGEIFCVFLMNFNIQTKSLLFLYYWGIKTWSIDSSKIVFMSGVNNCICDIILIYYWYKYIYRLYVCNVTSLYVLYTAHTNY